MTAPDERSILALNVGSSTLKVSLFPFVGGDDPLWHGVLEYTGPTTGQLRITDATGHSESRELVVNRACRASRIICANGEGMPAVQDWSGRSPSDATCSAAPA